MMPADNFFASDALCPVATEAPQPVCPPSRVPEDAAAPPATAPPVPSPPAAGPPPTTGPPATGLFSKQGVQLVCCSYHANKPKDQSEEFATWTLTKITPVTQRSAVAHFTSADSTRGSPYKRGRGRTIWHRTWNVTLRAGSAGGRHFCRDYTPISSWMEWERGECELLVTFHPGMAELHDQPIGGGLFGLTKPKTALSVPSLVPPTKFAAAAAPTAPDALEHKGVLLVLEGAAGIPVAAQVLQHTDPTTCFGQDVPPLRSPVHLIYACERDDVPMTGELGRWCTAEEGRTARLQRLVLAVSSAPKEDRAAAVPQNEEAEAGLKALGVLDNVSIVQGEESPLTSELLRGELAPLLKLGRCRVVVSGGAAFNSSMPKMLEAQGVDPSAITVVEA